MFLNSHLEYYASLSFYAVVVFYLTSTNHNLKIK
jgi:hypothetical protein